VKAEFEPAARQELIESVQRYLAEAGAVHAAGFEIEVTRVVGLLLRLPELGTPGVRNTRSMPLRRYPYSVHYRVEPGLIRILAVAHHSRRPGYWKKRG
jgi:plasmid stabilization system protein ParE